MTKAPKGKVLAIVTQLHKRMGYFIVKKGMSEANTAILHSSIFNLHSYWG
jgi:hypothetical protein